MIHLFVKNSIENNIKYSNGHLATTFVNLNSLEEVH